jgi:hypothetical protein
MTGSEIKTFTESILDGITLDDTLFYQLLNIAKVKREEARLWQYLKKLNSSNQAAASVTLPTDFAQDYKIMVGTDTEYLPVAFEEQHIYRNVSNRYYLNVAGGTINLLGTIRSGVLYIFYKKFTDDITSSTSPEFPARFHPILAFDVAGYYQMGVDADDIFARMSPENKAAAGELQRAMVSWDTALALRSQDHRIGMESGNTGEVSLEQM